jgi:hypothetical protein
MSEDQPWKECSDEEWYPVTLEFTIPDTDEFHRIDVLDKEEEESALQWMYEQCGEDFDEFEWT